MTLLAAISRREDRTKKATRKKYNIKNFLSFLLTAILLLKLSLKIFLYFSQKLDNSTRSLETFEH